MRFIRSLSTFAMVSLTVLALQSIPAAEATNCQAIGRMRVKPNQSSSRYNSIVLIKNGAQVGQTSHTVYTDIYSVTSQLPYTLGWAAGCSSDAIEECHGFYAGQTYIVGQKSTRYNHLSGSDLIVDSMCIINFDC